MTSSTTNYVSMLMFSADRTKVVLLIKNRPVFLNGKLCPVGGHIDEGEEPNVAAAREFFEEAGVQTEPDEWLKYAVCEGPDWVMHCFVSFDDLAYDCHTTTDEPIFVLDVTTVLLQVVTNPESAPTDLLALIGLAMQAGVREGIAHLKYA